MMMVHQMKGCITIVEADKCVKLVHAALHIHFVTDACSVDMPLDGPRRAGEVDAHGDQRAGVERRWRTHRAWSRGQVRAGLEIFEAIRRVLDGGGTTVGVESLRRAPHKVPHAARLALASDRHRHAAATRDRRADEGGALCGLSTIGMASDDRWRA